MSAAGLAWPDLKPRVSGNAQNRALAWAAQAVYRLPRPVECQNTAGDRHMTAEDFIALQTRLGVSRAELCRRLGIALNTGTAYARGRTPIPRTVALACAALDAGLKPYGLEW